MGWVVAQAQKSGKKSVVNMSLGGGVDEVIDQASEAMVKAGVYLVAAAGNDNKDACLYSPGRSEFAMTVGAINQGDKRASFSNHGKCVGIWAPGVGIFSTFKGGDTKTMDGTSMAAPHVAGAMAAILSQRDFDSVEQGFEFLQSISSLNRLKGIKGAYNGIAYVNEMLDIETFPPPPPAPVVCNTITCLFNPDCDICKGLFE